MQKASAGYEEAFAAFKAAGADTGAGDLAAKGKDRDAAAELGELRKMLSTEELNASERADMVAKRGSRLAYAVMSIVTLIGFVGAVLLSRKIVKPLTEAAIVAEQVAQGDLTAQLEREWSGRNCRADAGHAIHARQPRLARDQGAGGLARRGLGQF